MSLYDDLGVDPKAGPEDIKKAWRQKAKDKHPDRPDGDKSEFQKAQNAYMILGDPDKKANYDAGGDREGTNRRGRGQGNSLLHRPPSLMEGL